MKDLQLPPRPTFIGPDLNKVITDLQNRFEKLKTQHDANKNCLNCQSYIFDKGNILSCKLGKKYRKICDRWRQL